MDVNGADSSAVLNQRMRNGLNDPNVLLGI